MATHGDAATLETPAGDTAADVTVAVATQSLAAVDQDSAQNRDREELIAVITSPTVAVVRKSRITFGGATYVVADTPVVKAGSYQCALRRTVFTEGNERRTA
jgi:hypothetical protein